jgi:hypothetical protein
LPLLPLWLFLTRLSFIKRLKTYHWEQWENHLSIIVEFVFTLSNQRRGKEAKMILLQ